MSLKFIAIAAVTLDGKIAKHKNHLSDWTSKEDKAFLHRMLDKCDAIIVGNNTYKTAKKPLSKRNCLVFTHSAASLPNLTGRSNLVNYDFDKNNRAIFCNPQRVDVKKIIETKKYKKIAILGGAQTYTYCLQNKMFNELYLTIEPLVFGKGINLFAPLPPSPPKGRAGERLQNYKFKLVSIKKLNKKGSLLLRYVRDQK